MQTLEEDDLLRQQYDLLTRIWARKETNPEEQNDDRLKTTVSLIINKAEAEDTITLNKSGRSRLGKRKVWLMAASFLIIVLTGWIWARNTIFSQAETRQEAIEARKGSRTRSLLPDGTTVWLNAGSKLYYDGNFSGPTREVRLEGEAFFDVVKKPDRPFIVHTSGIDIKVLGTAFNVKSYPEDKTVETTLYRGSVQVFRENNSRDVPIELKPNEKLIVPKQAANEATKLPVESNSTTAKAPPVAFTKAFIDSTKKENERLETAWMYSRLEFNEDSFEELARQMERWYNVTIVFNDEKTKRLKVTAKFEKETIEQALQALKEGFPIQYKINNHDIYIGSSD